MRQAVDETLRRRTLQQAYNAAHGITPATIRKEIRAGIAAEAASRAVAFEAVGQGEESKRRAAELLEHLEAEMMQAAAELDFERAARLRDQIAGLRDGKGDAGKGRPRGRGGRSDRKGGSATGRIPRPKR